MSEMEVETFYETVTVFLDLFAVIAPQ